MKMNIQENIILAPHTTFKIGGPARYFIEAKSAEEIKEAVLWAREKGVPYFLLGGGSNLLVSDDGFNGLVIKIKTASYKIQDTSVTAEAGAPLAKLVAESANNDLTGLEWAVGIPGTIGGAVCGNAGAYGHSTSEAVIHARAMDQNSEIVDFNNQDCHFCYRGSIFKESGNKLIILETELKLIKGNSNEIKEKIKKIISERAGKIPHYPSSGSFFKNYIVDEKSPTSNLLLKNFPELKNNIKGGKIATGYFIEQCDLKGKTIGGAQISEQHANFIINIGNAKAIDVLGLAEICKREVAKKFGVELEIEKKLIGF